jgi:ATP-dependent protease ClpP protease subunit
MRVYWGEKEMKRLFIILCVLLVGVYAYSFEGGYIGGDGNTTAKSEDSGGDDKVQSICPKTLIKDNDKCSKCHIVIRGDDGYRYGIKEVAPYSEYEFPTGTGVVDGKLTYYLGGMYSDGFMDFVDYAKRHPEFGKHIVVEVNSFGGSIFEAWRIKSLIVEMEKSGYIVETTTRGVALSAGFLVFVSGTIGYRSCDPNAEFMMHELWTIEWPKIATPASKEEEARTFRHLQDNINAWIASRGNMTAEQINKKVKFKEAWLTGAEMLEFKFADKVVGD